MEKYVLPIPILNEATPIKSNKTKLHFVAKVILMASVMKYSTLGWNRRKSDFGSVRLVYLKVKFGLGQGRANWSSGRAG
jgi:hypothetical protein